MIADIKGESVFDRIISELNLTNLSSMNSMILKDSFPKTNEVDNKRNKAKIAIYKNKKINLDELVGGKTSKILKSKEKDLERKVKTKIVKSKKANLKFDRFDERMAIKDYNRHTDLYKKFHGDYLKSTTMSIVTDHYQSYESEENDTRTFEWGEDIINYKERKDLVRNIQMNALMGGEHNFVDPSMKQLYEFWKYASKFNMMMSFLLYDTAFNT